MAKKITLEAVMKRLDEISVQIKAVGRKIDFKSKAKTNAEKDAIKKELLKNAPYGVAGLKKLGTKACRMLASGMGLNCFSKNVKEVESMILKVEKKKK